MARIMDAVFFLYFFTHIPITIFFDSQIVFANSTVKDLYPGAVVEMVKSYSESFKDPMVLDAPEWYMSFCICEVFLQFPFFFVAAYAFFKGGCRWIRVPALVYASHVSTTVIAILYHIMLYDFSSGKHPGPSTLNERLMLSAIYAPYLIVPLLMLIVMLFSSDYQPMLSKSGYKSEGTALDRPGKHGDGSTTEKAANKLKRK